jgi:gluconolactonase
VTCDSPLAKAAGPTLGEGFRSFRLLRTPPLGGGDSLASGANDLVIDNDGRVYSITAAGIEVFTESGQPLGIIPVTCSPTGARCQALAFGGQEKRILYVAGNGTLLGLQMVARGFTGRAK